MAKGTELQLMKRSRSGNAPLYADGRGELFDRIAAPDTFGSVYATSAEAQARRAYLRAFFYGLYKYMPAEEYGALLAGLAAGAGEYRFRRRTAVRLQARAGRFARVKQAYPWEGAAEFERRFFAALRRRVTYCEKERRRSRAYRTAHREEIRAYDRAYYAAHCEELRRKALIYHRAHREERLATALAYREQHREELRIKARIYHQTHREERNAKAKEYRERHSKELAAYFQAYRTVHREERNAQKRAHYAAHREEIKAKRLIHREEILAKRRAYYAAHREEIIARDRARRAQRKAEENTIDEGRT